MYGEEALATLIKRMEDDRDRLVVILSGYTDEMKKFMDSNPGLKSRFNRYVDFVDYKPEELLQIFKYQCNKFEYKLDNKAEEKLMNVIGASFSKKDKSFGNGRFIRNVFEKCVEKQSDRIVNSPTTSDVWYKAFIPSPSNSRERLMTLTEEDIPSTNSKIDTNYLV
jgi:AAA+ superfamily predicted ATPase